MARADRVELPSGDGLPVPPDAGDVILAGLDRDGQPVDGQVIAFPSLRIEEGLDDDTVYREVPLEGAVATIGYVRALPEVASLALLDMEVDNRVLATAELPLAEVEAGYRLAPLTRPSTNSACGHVVILSGGQADRDWAIDLPEDVRLVAADPIHLALIDAALARLPPLLCQGVRRVALVELPETETRGRVITNVSGDMVNINLGYRDEGRFLFSREELEKDILQRVTFQRVFIHEVGHAVDALLGSQGRRPASGGGWVPQSRSLARDTIERVRVQRGFSRAWLKLHNSFVDQGWADMHAVLAADKEVLRTYDSEQVAHAGVMSWYAGTGVGDDIAEAIMWPIMQGVFDEAGITHHRHNRPDAGCMAMRAYTDGGVPSRLVALYAKLKFLEDLGLLAAEDVLACMGPGLNLVEDQRGFVVSQGDIIQRRFINSPESRIEGDMYEFGASGGLQFGEADVRARIRLRVPIEVIDGVQEWPRGVYPITPLDGTDLRFVSDDEPAASFAVTDGFLLVARASNDLIIGSAFITEGFRYDAPFPVPQVFDPPLIVTFIDDAPPQ